LDYPLIEVVVNCQNWTL